MVPITQMGHTLACTDLSKSLQHVHVLQALVLGPVLVLDRLVRYGNLLAASVNVTKF